MDRVNRRSVRWRITTLATVLVAVVLAVAGMVVVAVVKARLYANLDGSLDQRADQIEALVVTGDVSALANRNAEDRFVQIVGADGTVVAATPNVERTPPLGDVADQSIGWRSVTTRDDLALEDDGYRVLVRRFDASGVVQFVVVGENVDDLRDSIKILCAVLLVLFPVTAVALGGMVWWLVGRTLRPVEVIRREVSRIGLDRLDHRVPARGTGDEIDRLAATMNDMLARLEASEAQQRRFVADASHELRTPLTRLRILLEVDARRSDADLPATARSALHDVTEMHALIDDLLFLARVDAGRARRPFGAVDLDAIVETEVAAARAEYGPSIAIDADPVMIAGDASQIARLVRNLLSNAGRHAVTQVRVTVRAASEVAELIVEDDGTGIPPRGQRADLPPVRTPR